MPNFKLFDDITFLFDKHILKSIQFVLLFGANFVHCQSDCNFFPAAKFLLSVNILFNFINFFPLKCVAKLCKIYRNFTPKIKSQSNQEFVSEKNVRNVP